MEDGTELNLPQQAVILCGGLGTRLRPLTENMPKPMAPVNGKPFLHYLIEQVRDQGIRRILLLTGYRSEMITPMEAVAPGALNPSTCWYSLSKTFWARTNAVVWVDAS